MSCSVVKPNNLISYLNDGVVMNDDKGHTSAVVRACISRCLTWQPTAKHVGPISNNSTLRSQSARQVFSTETILQNVIRGPSDPRSVAGTNDDHLFFTGVARLHGAFWHEVN